MAYSRTQWVESETALSAENMNNIENGVEEALTKVNGNTSMWEYIRNLVYPVGSIYMSASDANPSALFGGTWVAWGSGRVPVGVNMSDSSFNAAEKTGGAKDAIVPSHNHTFTGNALGNHNHSFTGNALGAHSHSFTGTAVAGHTHTGPSHYHSMAHTHTEQGVGTPVKTTTDVGGPSSSSGKTVLRDVSIPGKSRNTSGASASNTGSAGTGNTGTAGAHTPSGSISSNSAGTPSGTIGNSSAGTPSGTISTVGSSVTNANLQPYITCYMWKRTA